MCSGNVTRSRGCEGSVTSLRISRKSLKRGLELDLSKSKQMLSNEASIAPASLSAWSPILRSYGVVEVVASTTIKTV